MPLTEGMKIISHRTHPTRPEFHVASCEVYVQSTRRIEKMPLIFRVATDERGIPRLHVHVAQLTRIMEPPLAASMAGSVGEAETCDASVASRQTSSRS